MFTPCFCPFSPQPRSIPLASSIPALQIEESLHPLIELVSGAIQLTRDLKRAFKEAGFPLVQEDDPIPQTAFCPYIYRHQVFVVGLTLQIKDVAFKGITISVVFSEDLLRPDLTAITLAFDAMEGTGRIERISEFDRFFNAMTRIFGQDREILEQLIQEGYTFDRKAFLAHVNRVIVHAKRISAPSSC